MQKPNIESIRRLLRISHFNLHDLEKASKYIDLSLLENYSKSQNMFSIQSYLDYIENLEKIGIPFTKKKLLPEDFSKAHNASIKKVKIVTNKLMDKSIQQRYMQLEKNKYHDNKFIIRPAKSLNDMKDEAKQ